MVLFAVANGGHRWSPAISEIGGGYPSNAVVLEKTLSESNFLLAITGRSIARAIRFD